MSYFWESLTSKTIPKMRIFLFLAVLLVAACGPKNTTDTQIDADQSGTEQMGGMQSFGDKITPTGAVRVDQLAAQMGDREEMTVKIEGIIEDVCQKKGCWMNVYTPGKEDEAVFVKFKDYAYFMPLDAAGKRVIMEGVAKRETTSVDELRHYAEDKGRTPEEIAAITEPETKVNFLASGVLLLPAE